jgi:Uncharacterized protein conserved in bacteria
MTDQAIYWSSLYDHYNSLLTDKQKELFEDYYFDNLTLQEIADNNDISRNAVHKTLNIITKKLEIYEEKLKYYKKTEKIKELIKDEKLLNTVLEIL